MSRKSSGLQGLDEALGGGFLSGKKVIVYGATGVGKSILGVTFAHKGISEESHPGLILDISKGVDEQSQLEYAKQFFGWLLKDWKNLNPNIKPEDFVSFAYRTGSLDDFTETSEKIGRRYSGHGYSEEVGTSFLRYHLPKSKRIVIDGSEPYETAKDSGTITSVREFFHGLDSFRFALIFRDLGKFPIDNEEYWNSTTDEGTIAEYVQTGEGNYVFGKNKPGGPYDRELDSKRFIWDRHTLKPKGPNEANVRKDLIAPNDIVSMFLQTTQERDIFNLINRGIEPGSLDAEVSTVIAMGYFPVTAENPIQRRGLAILKHRGSNYNPTVLEYKIGDSGIQLMTQP